MKRKILIIANPNSIWTKTYIENVLVNKPFEVYLLSYGDISKEFLDFYETSGVHFVFGSGSTNNVKRIIEIFLVKNTIKPDFIHVMFVSLNACKLAELMMRKGCKLILSYMGSDIFRLSNDERLGEVRYLKDAYAITLPSDKAYNEFKRTFGIINPNIYDAEFGDQVLDYIREVSIQEKQAFRSCFGIDKGKFVISVGYNGNSSQNHIRVLEQISKLPTEIKDHVFLLLHVSYGLQDEKYVDELKLAAENTGCGYSINTDFLTYQDMARFRQCTDCYINAQSTDDYSVSLIEHLYVGSIIISASWLRYDRLTKLGVEFIVFNDYDEIPAAIVNAIKNKNCINSSSLNSMKLIKCELDKLYSWNICKGMWMDVYNNKGIKYYED